MARKHKMGQYRDGRRRFTLDLPQDIFDKVEGLAKKAGRKPSPQVAILLDEALQVRALDFFPKIEGLGLIAGHSTTTQIAQLLEEALRARGMVIAPPAGTAPEAPILGASIKA